MTPRRLMITAHLRFAATYPRLRGRLYSSRFQGCLHLHLSALALNPRGTAAARRPSQGVCGPAARGGDLPAGVLPWNHTDTERARYEHAHPLPPPSLPYLSLVPKTGKGARAWMTSIVIARGFIRIKPVETPKIPDS